MQVNEFGRKPAHAVPIWKAPASTRKPRPANEGCAVEGLEGQARLGIPARGRRGRPAKTQGCGNPPPATPRWPAVFSPVLAGACQFGTAWAGLRLNSFIQDPGLRQGKTPIRPLLPTNITYVYLQPPPPPGRDRTTSDERTRAHGVCSSSASCDELAVSAAFQLDQMKKLWSSTSGHS